MNEAKKIVPADRVDAIKEYYFSRKLRELAKIGRASCRERV